MPQKKSNEVEILTDAQVVPMSGFRPIKDWDKMIAATKNELKEINKDFVLTWWRVGGHVREIIDNKTYGDHKVEQYAAEIGCKVSWLYEVKCMHETYSDETLIKRFLNKSVSATTLTRLASIKDAPTRVQLESRLLSGELTCDDVKAEKKRLQEEAAKLEKGPGGRAGADADDSLPDPGEQEPADSKPEEAKPAKGGTDASISAEVRAVFRAIDETAKALTSHLTKLNNAFDRIDEIADEAVSDSTMSYVASASESINTLHTRLTLAREEIKKRVV